MNEVVVGSIWQDMDRRQKNRYIKVIATIYPEPADFCAYAKVVSGTSPLLPFGSRSTRIRLNRFKEGSTGYKLVSRPATIEG